MLEVLKIHTCTKMSELAQQLSDLLGKPLSICEVALKRCGNDQHRATDYILTHEDEGEAFWNSGDDRPSELAVVQFTRWGENLAVVDEETLSEIVAKCVAEGVLFTDSSFPPKDESLYFDPSFARNHWKCHDCNRENVMPPHETLEQYRRANPGENEVRDFYNYIAGTNPLMAQALQSNPRMATQLMLQTCGWNTNVPPLACAFCKGQFPLGILEAKPSQWLRPAQVRDDITLQYGAGAPWRLIRDSVRPDDVRQGAVGDCWFVGALSILAHQKPKLLKKIIPFNQEYSEIGAYLVRLCKDGLWRNVIIDDHFPCNRAGRLTFTGAARRQLWVPLIEKAAAKLFGCYEGLHSGTLCEAFALLTGFATDREVLREELSIEQKDVLWARVVSGHSEGFLIGLACAPKSPSLTLKDLHAKGLQAPHAYVVLNAKELRNGSKILQLGNPWGERSPSTWEGPWGNRSELFKSCVKSGDLPPPSNEINSNGEFWISFDDVITHFSSIEFCRTADSELVYEQRIRGWLPAVTGLGDVFRITTNNCIHGKIRIDLSLYQESNSVRESSKGAASTSVDLGFVLLRENDNSAIAAYNRIPVPEISTEVFLDQNTSYVLVPLSFNNVFSDEHRKVVVALRTTGDDLIKSLARKPNNASLLKSACNAYCTIQTCETKELFPGLVYSLTKDPSGAFIRAENLSTRLFIEINFDADDSVNVSSTRGGLITRDIIPPGRSSICAVLTAKSGAQRYALSLSMAAARVPTVTSASNFPPLSETDDSPEILDLHAPTPLQPGRLIPLRELSKRTTDPNGAAVMMNLLFRFNSDVQRLTMEYIDAGIDPDEASKIANEEAEHLYI